MRLLRLLASLALGATLASAAQPFRLARDGERAALLTPAGERIFLLGLNHVAEGAPREAAARAAYFAAAAERMRAWGFANLGYGAPRELHGSFPFLAEIRLTGSSHYQAADSFRYDDVFDPAFQRDLRARVQAFCAAHAAHPNLVGFYWTDTPRWDLATARRRRGDDWVSALRRLPATAAGKIAYVAFLRERHGSDPARYAAAYGHAIARFDDLLGFDFREFDRENPAGRADDELFLGHIAREFYRVTGEAFREFAPGRLIFGERYKLRDHPDFVLREAAKWIDVLSIQPGPGVGPLPGPGRDEIEFDAAEFDRLHALTGKPILICDHQVSFPAPGRPVTLWHQAADEAEAAAIAAAFVRAAAARPYIVGYQRCQYADSFRPERGNMLKQGLVTAVGEPQATIVAHLAALHAEIAQARARPR